MAIHDSIEQMHQTDGLARDWAAVGSDIRVALTEVATELGGEEFAAEVHRIATPDEESGAFPAVAGVKFLEDRYPGALQLTLDRAHEIQLARHQAERATFRVDVGHTALGFFRGMNGIPTNLFRRS